MIYKCTVTVEMEVEVEVEGNSRHDAKSTLEMICWSIDTGGDSDVTVIEASENSTDIGDLENKAEEKWSEMSYADRVGFLVSMGVDGGEACRWVGDEEEYQSQIEEYFEKLEVD